MYADRQRVPARPSPAPSTAMVRISLGTPVADRLRGLRAAIKNPSGGGPVRHEQCSPLGAPRLRAACRDCNPKPVCQQSPPT